jgi:hypothetical protein
MLDFLGLTYDNLLLGFLQHGHGAAVWPWQELPKTMNSYYPVFVWNKETETAALSKGLRHVRSIGAPWLYLLKQRQIEPFTDQSHLHLRDSEVRDVLIVPEHGGGHYNIGSKYSEIPKKYRKEIGDADATVVLYYTEYCDPTIRLEWEKFGFVVTTNGMAWGPENRTVWSYNGGRPKFLNNTLKLLAHHQNVICASPTTMSLYSISLGLPTKISQSHEVPRVMGIASAGKGVERLRKYESERDNLAQVIFGNDFNKLSINSIKSSNSRLALGFDSIKTKQELLQLLPLQPGLIPTPENL